MGPSEDPEDTKARQLERKMSLLERRRAAEDDADDLTTDLQSVYGFGGLSMLGQPGQVNKTKSRKDKIINKLSNLPGNGPTSPADRY